MMISKINSWYWVKKSVGYRMVILNFFQNLESYNFACHHVDLQEADSTDDMNRYQSMKKKIADITKLKDWHRSENEK